RGVQPWKDGAVRVEECTMPGDPLPRTAGRVAAGPSSSAPEVEAQCQARWKARLQDGALRPLSVVRNAPELEATLLRVPDPVAGVRLAVPRLPDAARVYERRR